MTIEEFEDLAREFYRDTGYIAPGKDVPAACGGDPRHEYEARREAWVVWRQKRAARGPATTEPAGRESG